MILKWNSGNLTVENVKWIQSVQKKIQKAGFGKRVSTSEFSYQKFRERQLVICTVRRQASTKAGQG
jgi:hypothetical protein